EYGMLNVDPVGLTEAHPKLTLWLKRLRAALIGKNYFFNGQKKRARVFSRVDRKIPFENYVETGTFLGMTTDFLARRAKAHDAHVYSCEIDSRYHAIANRTVGDLPNVSLQQANSVDFLRELSPKLVTAMNFVYLDAHWNDYLPLRDELLILRGWQNSVVLIDDFKVPSDPRFGWDRYDEDREICREHTPGPSGARPSSFPTFPAPDGRAAPGGSCVRAMSTPLQDILDQTPLLRSHDH